MARILLLLAIGFAIWLVFRGFFRSQVGDAPAPSRDAEDMVACSRCGVNMPRSEAKDAGGGKFTCRDPSACKHAQ
jgi:hypothetical protein